MKKLSLKKFLLGSLIALQLSNGVIGSNLSTVYAKENDEEKILFDENGKMLHMIGMIINDHEEITVGYVFVKDSAVYVEDVRNGKIYNFTNISEYLKYPEILYTEIQNVLPDELKNADFITQEEANELVNRFSITQDTVKLWGMDDLYDYTYETFAAPNFDNKNLRISNCSMFNANDVFHSFTVTDDYNEANEELDLEANNYRLGLTEINGSYPIYSNIYQDAPVGEENKMGIITRYYVFNKDGERIATLKTQEQVDEFININVKFLDEYTWKASFYNGYNIDRILDAIENNQPISNETTTYFVDYKPACKSLKK